MADFVPDDVRLGLTRENGGDPLRWGICGAGHVSKDFTLALENIPHAANVVHIGCRDKERAVKLADELGLTDLPCSGGYDGVMNDPNVEIVYIGTITTTHKALALAAIDKGKHVCVEKPAALCLSDVQEMVEAAKAKGVFLFENLWARFFPAVAHMRRCVEEGVIGEVKIATGAFIMDSSDILTEGLNNLALGGGAVQQMAIYPVGAVTAVLGTDPLSIKAVGRFSSCPPPYEHNIIDSSGYTVLEFKDAIGSVKYENSVSDDSGLKVLGTKGYIKIGPYSQCPTAIEVMLKTETKTGKMVDRVCDTNVDYTIPDINALRKEKKMEYFYPNSAGFQYVAAALYRCIRAGLKECPQYTTADMLGINRILQEMRHQIFTSKGVTV